MQSLLKQEDDVKTQFKRNLNCLHKEIPATINLLLILRTQVGKDMDYELLMTPVEK